MHNVQGHSCPPGCPCYPIKIFESNLGTTHLTFGNLMLLMWPTNKRPTMHRPREKEKKTNHSWDKPFLCFFCAKFFFCEPKYNFFPQPSSYGHTTVKAPHPIRTAKLSTVGPDQYFGRGLQGNLGCCMSFCFNFFSLLRTFIFLHPTFFCWPNFEKGASGAWYTK